MFRKSLLAAALLAGTSLAAMAGSVTPVTNASPPDGVVYGFLLTDGTILFQGGLLIDFYRFKPDNTGSYVNGTLYPAAALPPNYIPDATSGGVLPDGRVLLIGGEYTLLSNNSVTFSLTNKMAVYDPKADTWTMVAPPHGWDFIGDSPWTTLANGHFMLGNKLTKQVAELDPKTLTWTEVSSFAKEDVFAEEGLTLLPDGSVLTVNLTDRGKAQRFIPNPDPSKSRWDDTPPPPVMLPATDINAVKNIPFDNGMKVYHPPGEIGPAILMPDGKVFNTGANCNVPGPKTDPNACVIYQPIAHTATYDTKTNTWAAGPDLPHPTGAEEGGGDTFANLLPSGNVLFQTNSSPGLHDPLARANARYTAIRNGTMHLISAEAQAPQQSCPPFAQYKFYEFDGAKLIPEPAATSCGQPGTLLLPTGQVMLGTSPLAVYNPSGTFQNAWRPVITKFIFSRIDAGGNYEIFGTQFNGLGQPNAFGDEFQVDGNFPMVRITNTATGHVRYAHTYNFSTMAVATGSATVSTWFQVPTNAEAGASTLEVVANGIPSLPMGVTVNVASEAANQN
jgi:hypothetical protein